MGKRIKINGEEYIDYSKEEPIKKENNGYDKISDLDIPKKKNNPEPIKNENLSPPPINIPKQYYPEEEKKTNKGIIITYLILGSILVFTIIIGIFWFVSEFSDKEFGSEVSIDEPDNNINISNSFPLNDTTIININIDDDIIEEVADRILEELNKTNSS